MAHLQPPQERNQEATVWCGGLEPQATEELVCELMQQAGPVVSVSMPRDKVTNTHQSYAFVEFRTPDDAEYAIRVLNNVRLFGKALRINKATREKQKEQEWSANLFVGNLDAEVDDKTLFDAFQPFGNVLSAKVMVDPDSGQTRGFGFVSYETFEAADAAIEAMSGQFLCNKQVNVSYAYKKDGTKGERHGSAAERLLAAQAQAKLKQAGIIQPRLPPPLPALYTTSAIQPPPLPAMPPPPPMGYGMGMGMGMGMPMGMMGMGMAPPPPPQFYPPPNPYMAGGSAPLLPYPNGAPMY